MSERNIVALILTIISLVVVYPGLTEPILQISIALDLPLIGKITVHDQTQSILQTVETLYNTNNKLVAGLILFFSVIIPVLKGLIVVVVVFIENLKFKKKLFTFVFAIGKWSMADVFVVGIFIAFLSTESDNAIDAVLLPGFNYFVAYCIISLAAIQLVKLE